MWRKRWWVAVTAGLLTAVSVSGSPQNSALEVEVEKQLEMAGALDGLDGDEVVSEPDGKYLEMGKMGLEEDDDDEEHAKYPNGKQYAQVNEHQHAHLFSPFKEDSEVGVGEYATPGITREEYKKRRNALREKLRSASGSRFVAVFLPKPEIKRSGDTDFEYEADVELYYLTGVVDSSVALILLGDADYLVKTGGSLGDGLWTSGGVDHEILQNTYGLELTRLPNNMEKGTHVFCDKSVNPAAAEAIKIDMASAQDPTRFVQELRVIKSPAELKVLKSAWDLSSRTHRKAMQQTRLGLPAGTEAFIRGLDSFYFESNYASHAYPPIIASAENGNVLHYHSDNGVLDDGELVLMDAGAKLHGYCGDVSRTWPANCKFTEAQRSIYSLVVEAQDHALQLARRCHQEAVSLHSLDLATKRFIREGLAKLGVSSEALPQPMPHAVSHHIGLDVHDVPEVGDRLREGMAFTIEPGIYVGEKVDGLDSAFWNINVRVEDDCYVTADSVECPTMASGDGGAAEVHLAPRNWRDVEKVCGARAKHHSGSG